jgi:hypothetical protein
MDAPARVVHPLIAIALVLAAVCGYLLGGHRVSGGGAQSAALGPSRVATTAGLLLEYPTGWEQASSNESIPGLTLKEAVTLRPRGAAGSGLLGGMLAGGEPGPLPAAFLTRLSATPHAEVVSLVSTQAYRYSNLSLPGYARVFDLYVIPASGTGMRLMACFAPKRLTTAGQECERIVANVTLTGTAAVTLTPVAAYAGALAPVISALDRERARARRQLAQSSSASSVVAPSRGLAGSFTRSASSVTALEAPGAATLAQATLARALTTAGKAYDELASAAEAQSVSAYDGARSQIAGAEDGVDRALESLVLLGYGPA